jgi:hypothetical protein
MTDQTWLFIMGQIITAGGIYAAIRADLREAMVRVSMLERKTEGCSKCPA